MGNTTNITQERAAQRFSQIAVLERQLALKLGEVALAKAHAKELSDEADALLGRIRTAARDDGELPLFDIDSRRPRFWRWSSGSANGSTRASDWG